MEEYAKKKAIDFVKWLDGECDRSSDGDYFYYGKNKYFTVAELYEIFSTFTSVS
jgi:hypothetical protein